MSLASDMIGVNRCFREFNNDILRSLLSHFLGFEPLCPPKVEEIGELLELLLSDLLVELEHLIIILQAGKSLPSCSNDFVLVVYLVCLQVFGYVLHRG